MLLLLGVACTAGSKDTGSTTDGATLSAIQDETFTLSCAFSSCHTASSPAGSLDLTDGHAYAALVDVPSVDATGEVLVIPGDSAGSYLIKKLSADPTIVGDVMPSGTSTGLDAPRLANIVAWIDAGAPDN